MREDVRRQVMIGTAAMQELKFSYYDFFLSNSQLRLKRVESSRYKFNLVRPPPTGLVVEIQLQPQLQLLI